MTPLKFIVSANLTGLPSTTTWMPPSNCSLSPVAVTMISASSSRPDCRRMPASVKLLDLVGDDVRLARLDGAEEVGVGREAQPLVPWIVTRREMSGDVVVVAELRARLRHDPLLDRFRLAPGEIVEIKPEQHVVPARQAVSEPHRQMAAQPFGDRVLRRARDDIGRRPLQHGHMRRGFGHGGNDRYRGGAAADHDHPLAGVIEILGPRLRMHQAAAKLLDAGKLRRIAAA